MNSNRMKRSGLAVVIGAAAVLSHPVLAKDAQCAAFSELRMSLERNATDGDTEVVLFAQGEDEGLKRLTIIGPDGRHVATLSGAGRRRSIGLREFHLESAEPPDLDAVLRSFPEGTYRFVGRTVTGDCLEGTVPLSHQIAPTTTQLTPLEEQIVPIGQLVLSWTPIAGVERYVIELNNENTGAEMLLHVFPPTTSLAIAPQFLQGGSEYQFGVGVRMPTGNITFVERTFFTAP
jgi:hypothetical protein